MSCRAIRWIHMMKRLFGGKEIWCRDITFDLGSREPGLGCIVTYMYLLIEKFIPIINIFHLQTITISLLF